MKQTNVSGGLVHDLPRDLEKSLTKTNEITALWENLTDIARNEFICWVENTKQEKTRTRRISRTIEELLEGQKRPCCWVGCIHRTDKKPSKWQQDVLIDKKHKTYIMINLKTILLTAHIKPVIGVTTIVLVTSALFGATFHQLLITFFAVFTGQLSIGFSNNVLDVANDKKSGRKDKTIVNGDISKTFVLRLALIFLGLSIIFSLLLGLEAGVILLSTLAIGWSYNLFLKNTPFSIACYMAAFGLIPAFSSVLTNSRLTLLTVLCYVFLGSTMHYADALGDYVFDNKAGIRGFTNIFSLSVSKTIFKFSTFTFLTLSVINIYKIVSN